MPDQQLIDGVVVRQLKQIVDERGFLMELLRSDWPMFEKFGQAYVTVCNPGYAKAWHYHKKQTDNFAIIKGNAKLVLFDWRRKSKTFGTINEFDMSEKKPIIVRIPPNVVHGFMALGEEQAYFVNVPTRLYDYSKPDEHKLPFDSKDVPYEWAAKKGG